MNPFSKHIGQFILTCLLVSYLLVACQSTDYPDPQPATTPSANQARILFVNAAPGSPALTFFIENTPAGQSRAFNEATGYIPSQVGPVQLRAKAASGQIGGVLGSNDIVYRASATNQNNFSASANMSYTAFVVDTLNRPRPATSGATNLGGPQFVVVTDTLRTPAAGRASVRVFNFTPDVPSVAVRLVDTSTNQGVATFPGRSYRTVSGSSLQYTSVPAGSYTLQVYTQSTFPADSTAPAATTTAVTLAEGKIYTLYTTGLARTGTLTTGLVQHN